MSEAAAAAALDVDRIVQLAADTAGSDDFGEPTWREDHLVKLLKERLGRLTLPGSVIALGFPPKRPGSSGVPRG